MGDREIDEIITPMAMEETKSRFKRICVFCGSSSGKKATYQEAAIELGKELNLCRKIGLPFHKEPNVPRFIMSLEKYYKEAKMKD